MGVVYLAEDTRLNRRVALKFLPPAVALDTAARARLEREARTTSVLDHPNIATIYEVGDVDGQAFIAMAYYEGETLRSRLARGPLPLSELLALTEQIASGLAAAHAERIVHRDLKPENAILTRSGQVKIVDFGLAKLVADDARTLTRMTEVGATVGTIAYMAPEQFMGEDVDEAVDVWALGVMMYEMATTRRPFDGANAFVVMDAIRSADPIPVDRARTDLPPEYVQVIVSALTKDRSKRTLTAVDVARAMAACRARLTAVPPVASTRKPALVLALGAAVIGLAAATTMLVVRGRETQWAREIAVPEIAAMIETNPREQYVAAYDLAVRAERSIPDDPSLAKFWPLISRRLTIHTVPEDAVVSFREYADTAKPWRVLGRTPLEDVRIPAGFFAIRIAKPGYEPVDDTNGTSQIMGVSTAITYRLDPVGSVPRGMVRVSSGGVPNAPRLPGADALKPVDLPDYWIDKYEVTNRDFKAFVDAGGYRDAKYWPPTIDAAARARFVDTTGRPGPLTWELGTYPEGQAEYPVTGVSWYEAAAYAAFVDKELPTLYHWVRAAAQNSSPDIAPLSNFAGRGPAPVGSHRGMNKYGTFDMAGNAKEWVTNEADGGKRYIMGGGWDEPEYMFTNVDARDPVQRLPTFGFRCIRPVAHTPIPADAQVAVKFPFRDFDRERPVSDDVFAAYKQLYSYDKGNLDPRQEWRTETDDWFEERISFNAAYGGERMAAHLFLPKRGRPPFQTVVWFPPSGALTNRNVGRVNARYFDFIVKSGRAMMCPILKSTYERGDGMDNDVPNTSSFWRDHVIDWSKDIARSIDYLDTRSEIAHDKVGYAGLSWGAAMAAIMPAMEPRIKAVVAIIGGFNLQVVAPEVSAVNFTPRVTQPTLMLNGRYDYFYPPTISQEPMFRLLGAPPDRKRHIVYETGHNIPRAEMIKETLDWFDRYLGPTQ